MRVKVDGLSKMLLLSFIVVISLDPTGTIFHAKEILFLVLIFFSFINKGIFSRINNITLFCLFFSLLLPIYGICIAVVKGSLEDTEYAFGQIKSFLFVAIIFFLLKVRFNDIIRILFINGMILSFLTILIFIISQYNSALFSIIYDTSLEFDNILISQRSYYGFNILGVYFKAGPLIFFSYTYALYFLSRSLWRNISIALSLFSLLIAGSRMPMLIAICLSIVYIFDELRNHKKLRLLITTIFGISLIILVIILASETDEISNSIKYSNISCYVEDISRGTNAFLGAGLGSVFYASGWGIYMPASELTYFDLVRIYGLPIASIFIYLVFYPVIFTYINRNRISLKYKRFIVSYFMYMIIAGTNPLLISSTGMLVWSIGILFTQKIKTQNNDICVFSYV